MSPLLARRRLLSPTLVTAVLVFNALGAGVAAARRADDGIPGDAPFGVALARGDITRVGRMADRVEVYERERRTAIDSLLSSRARAVLGHDKAAFLATLDGANPAFVAQEVALYQRLVALPFASWSYVLEDGRGVAPSSEVVERHGGADVWLPRLSLQYQLKGFDAKPVARALVYTFARRGERWLIAADDDLASLSLEPERDPWDHGDLVVKRGKSSLVLTHGTAAEAARIAALSDDAVAHVTRIWGTDWPRAVVVIVPKDQDELKALSDDDAPLDKIAALAISEFGGDGQIVGDGPAVSARIIINPANLRPNDPLTRNLLRHEVAHVASQRYTTGLMPAWLVEGFAEYVGNLGDDLPVDAYASDLIDEVTSGRVPGALPDDFGQVSTDLGLSYEGAWTACSYIAARFGQAKLLALYRSFTRPDASPDSRIKEVLGIDTAALTRQWREHLRRRMSSLQKLMVAPTGVPAADGRNYSGFLSVKSAGTYASGASATRMREIGFERGYAQTWRTGTDASPLVLHETAVALMRDAAGAASFQRAALSRAAAVGAVGTVAGVPGGRYYQFTTRLGARTYDGLRIVFTRGDRLVSMTALRYSGAVDFAGVMRRAQQQYARLG